MNRLFGAKKKKEEPKKYEGPSVGEVSTKMDERQTVIQKKVDDCNQELLKIKE